MPCSICVEVFCIRPMPDCNRAGHLICTGYCPVICQKYWSWDFCLLIVKELSSNSIGENCAQPHCTEQRWPGDCFDVTPKIRCRLYRNSLEDKLMNLLCQSQCSDLFALSPWFGSELSIGWAVLLQNLLLEELLGLEAVTCLRIGARCKWSVYGSAPAGKIHLARY